MGLTKIKHLNRKAISQNTLNIGIPQNTLNISVHHISSCYLNNKFQNVDFPHIDILRPFIFHILRPFILVEVYQGFG